MARKEGGDEAAIKDQLDAKEAEIAKLKKELADAKAPKKAKEPTGIKMSKPAAGVPGFPAEGSDGKGNLIKYAKDKETAKLLEKDGWKAA